MTGMKTRTTSVLTALAFGAMASAAPITWEGDTDANWSNPDNWDTVSLPGDSTADTVILDDPTSVGFLPTLDAAQPAGTGSITRIDFLNPGWTLGGTETLTITLDSSVSNRGISSTGAGVNTVSPDIVLLRSTTSGAVFNVDAGNTLVTQGTISQSGGNVGLYKRGEGVWRVQDKATTADLRFDTGTIEMDNASGDAFQIGFEIRMYGTALRWLRDDQLQDNKGIRTGDGILVDLNGHTDSFQYLSFGDDSSNAETTVETNGGLLTLTTTSPVRYRGYNGTQRSRYGTGVINGDIALTSGSVVWEVLGMTGMSFAATPTEEVQANGVISGDGGVYLQGDGMLVLTGSNTYAGDTKVEKWSGHGRDFTGGTLLVNGDATATSSATGTGTVYIYESATLGGTGTIGETGRSTLALSTLGAAGTSATATGYMEGGVEVAEVSNLATIAPGGVLDGELIGTLSVNGNVDLGDYTRLAIDLSDAGLSDVLAATGDVTLSTTGTVLDLSLLSGASLSGEYTLATFASLTGTFDVVLFDGIEVVDPTAGGAIGGTHSLVYEGASVKLAIIPEPSSAVLAMGVASLLLLRRRD